MRDFLWKWVDEGRVPFVLKLEELGGLGIENLRLRKEAFLAKCLWRFFMEIDVLWYRVIGE